MPTGEKINISIIREWTTNIEPASNIRLFNSPFFFPYFNDEPRKNRFLQNQISLP